MAPFASPFACPFACPFESGDAAEAARIFASCAGEADIMSANAGASEAASAAPPRNAGGVWSSGEVSRLRSLRAVRIFASAAGVALNMSFTGVFDIGIRSSRVGRGQARGRVLAATKRSARKFRLAETRSATHGESKAP